MIVVGIDEVGRGCWAGPLVAAAVVLGGNIPALRDSKLLSKKWMRSFASEIELCGSMIGIGWVWPEEIDRIGLTASVRAAMVQALRAINGQYDEIIIDGNYNFLANEPKAKCLIKADNSIPEVSAASIVAKVARDTYMVTEAAVTYPEYGFEKHVGYGTARHIEALRTYGTTPLHRMSYRPVAQIHATMSP